MVSSLSSVEITIGISLWGRVYAKRILIVAGTQESLSRAVEVNRLRSTWKGDIVVMRKGIEADLV